MNACRDGLQTNRAVVDGIERRQIGQQHLSGTDVGVGLLATDVLLTGLQRHAQRLVALGVDGNTNNTAWNGTLEAVTRSEERRVRATKAHRYAEVLGVPQNDVRAHFAG